MPCRRVAEEDLDEGVELAATSLIDCYERLVSLTLT